MKEYSVGTICTIKQTAPTTKFVGAECTITGGLATRNTHSFPNGLACYMILVQGQGDTQYAAQHNELIPKWIPPTEEFATFIQRVMVPVDVTELEPGS